MERNIIFIGIVLSAICLQLWTCGILSVLYVALSILEMRKHNKEILDKVYEMDNILGLALVDQNTQLLELKNKVQMMGLKNVSKY